MRHLFHVCKGIGNASKGKRNVVVNKRIQKQKTQVPEFGILSVAFHLQFSLKTYFQVVF